MTGARNLKPWLIMLLLLAALAAGALLPAVLGKVTSHETLRARLETLQSQESRFRELVIHLRHGVISNYDEANQWMQWMLDNRSALSAQIDDDNRLRPILDRYLQAVQSQELQWNDFKFRNALVRNSLRYFQNDAVNFMRTLPNDVSGDVLQHELMTLNNALFLQALGEGHEVSQIAQASLDGLRPLAVVLAKPLRLEFGRLSRHAEIISKHTPILEADVKNLIHGLGRDALLKLAEANHALLIEEQSRAGKYRATLLVGVILLLLTLALVVMRYLESLRQQAKDLALAGTVFESSQQGIVVTNARGEIVRVNPAFCNITGYSQAELLDKNPRILKSGLQDAAFYQAMWQSLRDTGKWRGEMRNRRKSGEHYVQWINIDAVSGNAGEQLFVGIASDISELVGSRERLANLAYFDTLTGLPNRVLFQDRLRQAMIQTRREHSVMALVFVDLDNFKTVNDTLGHAIGDNLLIAVAERLKQRVRESDTVARLGGDEFAIILNDAKGTEDMARIATQLIETLSVSYKLADYDVPGGASIGITFFPDDAMTPEELLKNADVAMYRAKERGRNNFQFFTGDMAANLAKNMRIENALRRALAASEMCMHYQPQFNLDGRVVGVEALMRWHSSELGNVPPDRFIPLAEKNGIITSLGEFALHEACGKCAEWRQHLGADFRIAVNLSAAQFRHEDLIERVSVVLHQFSLPGAALELEITESVVMEDVAHGQEVLRGLKALGCRIAIDDFGTGYSSLAYLRRFDVDVLKIDKSFVDGLGIEAEDTAVVQAIVSLARSLRLEVVAEGVETTLQLDCLKQLASDADFFTQGYLFSKPLPANEFEAKYISARESR